MKTSEIASAVAVENLTKFFYTDAIQTKALNSINMTINRQEFVSIMGPSGCGKSTLLSIIGLLDSPTEGSVSLNGQPINYSDDAMLAEFRNRYLGFIFQSFNLIPAMSVTDNVMLPLLYRKGYSSKQATDKVLEVLDKVGLYNRRNHLPEQLSGGQCQRVAIARALVGEPEIILADEPTGNLDSKMGAEIIDLLLKLNSEGSTIVMVTHDEAIASQTSKTYRLFDGSLK